MRTIEEIQNEIAEEFSMFEDWMDRYEYIIDIGRNMKQMPDEKKTRQNIIEGCQSKVWLDAELNDENRIVFDADSDAIITRGLVALLLKVYNNQTPDDIIDAKLFFIDDIGLSENLSPTRSNGLMSMIKQIKMYALAYKTKLES